MTTPFSTASAPCYGVGCPRHACCARYHEVDGSTREAIGTCATDGNKRPGFRARKNNMTTINIVNVTASELPELPPPQRKVDLGVPGDPCMVDVYLPSEVHEWGDQVRVALTGLFSEKLAARDEALTAQKELSEEAKKTASYWRTQFENASVENGALTRGLESLRLFHGARAARCLTLSGRVAMAWRVLWKGL